MRKYDSGCCCPIFEIGLPCIWHLAGGQETIETNWKLNGYKIKRWIWVGRMRPLRTFFCLFLCTALILCCLCDVCAKTRARDPRLNPLVERLIQDGFPSDMLGTLFSRANVKFDPSGVAMFFAHCEARLDYGQFLTKTSVSKGRAYMKKYRKPLSLAREAYGVDSGIITAILLVETRLGKYLGRRNVLNTLATLSSLTDPVLVETIWKKIPQSRKPARKAFLRKVAYRCPWAYKELVSFLKYTQKESIKPYRLKGSYAGAFGIAQFIPSRALTLAVDGNKDGKADLFTHEDAIYSVANYLVHFGWKQGMSYQERYKVLFAYNHSDVYVKTLMALAEKLSRKHK